MKLRNKKTGEICKLIIGIGGEYCVVAYNKFYEYDSPTELKEEWEDYEEPKSYWSVDSDGMIISEKDRDDIYDRGSKQIGNYFETKEEAEKAVEKLKAWKRLKDNGFFFDGRTSVHDNTVKIRARVGVPFLTDELTNDLDLLFGGEE